MTKNKCPTCGGTGKVLWDTRHGACPDCVVDGETGGVTTPKYEYIVPPRPETVARWGDPTTPDPEKCPKCGNAFYEPEHYRCCEHPNSATPDPGDVRVDGWNIRIGEWFGPCAGDMLHSEVDELATAIRQAIAEAHQRGMVEGADMKGMTAKLSRRAAIDECIAAAKESSEIQPLIYWLEQLKEKGDDVS